MNHRQQYGDWRACYYAVAVVAISQRADAGIWQLRSVKCALLLRPLFVLIICSTQVIITKHFNQCVCYKHLFVIVQSLHFLSVIVLTCNVLPCIFSAHCASSRDVPKPVTSSLKPFSPVELRLNLDKKGVKLENSSFEAECLPDQHIKSPQEFKWAIFQLYTFFCLGST